MAFRRTRGSSAAAETLALALAFLIAGCNYGFTGGGGLPEHVRTVYIASFENESDNFNVQTKLFEELSRELPRSLGLRLAGEGNADAVVRGRIVRYNDGANVYATGQQGNINVQQHQVEITVAIEVVDVRNNVILWDSQSLVGRGQYSQQTQEPSVALAQAIESLRQQIIDGMQSQW